MRLKVFQKHKLMQKIIGKVLFVVGLLMANVSTIGMVAVGKPGYYILSFVTISLMCYISYVAGKISE